MSQCGCTDRLISYCAEHILVNLFGWWPSGGVGARWSPDGGSKFDSWCPCSPFNPAFPSPNPFHLPPPFSSLFISPSFPVNTSILAPPSGPWPTHVSVHTPLPFVVCFQYRFHHLSSSSAARVSSSHGFFTLSHFILTTHRSHALVAGLASSPRCDVTVLIRSRCSILRRHSRQCDARCGLCRRRWWGGC
jgi:hypothetical protein